MDEQSNNKELITLQFKPKQLILIFSILTFFLGLMLGYFLWGRNTDPVVVITPTQEIVEQAHSTPIPTNSPTDIPQPTSTTAAQPTEQTELVRHEIPIDDDPMLGAEDAPITIVEFSDYQCSFCARFHNETFGLLIETYGEYIRFVYRDFPLSSIHPQAIPAAEAANCAEDQDFYWEFHNKLFTSNQQLFNAAVYTQFAEELGLDMGSFQECVDTRKYQSEVEADFAEAQQLGLRYTPTFFVNGIEVIGSKPFSDFAEIIESELIEIDQ
jgi:protein-disulfide isomerase